MLRRQVGHGHGHYIHLEHPEGLGRRKKCHRPASIWQWPQIRDLAELPTIAAKMITDLTWCMFDVLESIIFCSFFLQEVFVIKLYLIFVIVFASVVPGVQWGAV